MAICSVVTLCQAHGHLLWMCQSLIHSICDFTLFLHPFPQTWCPIFYTALGINISSSNKMTYKTSNPPEGSLPMKLFREVIYLNRP